jgi:hypothetical protein
MGKIFIQGIIANRQFMFCDNLSTFMLNLYYTNYKPKFTF